MKNGLVILAVLLLTGCPASLPTQPTTDGAPPAPPPPSAEGEAPAGPGPQTEDVKVEPGTGVVLSGTFTYDGTATGTYRIDVSSPKVGGGPPTPLSRTVLPALGPWQIEVPKNAGPIIINGFIEQGHGPGGGTPTATIYGLSVAETPLSDITLAPVAGGAITGTPPGPPPPADGGAPTPGSGAPGSPQPDGSTGPPGTPPTGTPPPGVPTDPAADAPAPNPAGVAPIGSPDRADPAPVASPANPAADPAADPTAAPAPPK